MKKRIEWAKAFYAYFLTVTTFVYAGLLFRLFWAYLNFVRLILVQPESFFTNKMLFVCLLGVVAGGSAIYWLAHYFGHMVSLTYDTWVDLFTKKWVCAYGSSKCEQGREGVKPSVFCVQHYEMKRGVDLLRAKKLLEENRRRAKR